MDTVFDKRANNFDFLRLFFALLVLFSHSYVLATGDQSRDPIVTLTRGQEPGGSIAVDSFFIISGFLITASFERSKTLFSYFKKRVFRIYPGFIVAMLVGAVCILPLSGGAFLKKSGGGRLLDFALQTTALREFHYVHAFATNVYPNHINGSTWTVLYEFLCYIGVAILGVFGILRANRILLGTLLVLMPLSLWFVIYGSMITGHHLARFVPLFLSGVVFYRLRHRIQLRTSWIVGAVIVLAVASQLPPAWTAVFPFAGAYLIFAVAFHPSIPLHGAGKYGDFSYGIYLYAFPIQQSIMRWFGRPISPLLLFVLAGAATACVAICSWYGVERWFLRQSHGPAKTSEQVTSEVGRLRAGKA
jgi:peptidoglycan/LPS O-acetylase OafA/YrhL